MGQDMMGRGGRRRPKIEESTGGWKAAVEILSNVVIGNNNHWCLTIL